MHDTNLYVDHLSEVDVWSLGVILYCLLTGTLPFDDDDEGVMREKIIKGDFEDPEWLSFGNLSPSCTRTSSLTYILESRDLIKKILVKDPAKRFGISQIFSHHWFTSSSSSHAHSNSLDLIPSTSSTLQPESPTQSPSQTLEFSTSSEALPLSAMSDSSYVSAASQFPTPSVNSSEDTPSDDVFDASEISGGHSYHRNPSEITLKRSETHRDHDVHPPTVGLSKSIGRLQLDMSLDENDPSLNPPRSNSKPPPPNSLRTPVRTKRRSVSSNLSDPASPIVEKQALLPRQDFACLLNTPAPIIFSTPLERNLLNSLSTLGFDTAQIVHSVLSDACDAAGAVWWMLKRKAEKKAAEPEEDKKVEVPKKLQGSHKQDPRKRGVAVQTDPPSLHSPTLSLARSAPQLAFVPPTPTFSRAATPPTTESPIQPLLSPSSIPGSSSRSQPSTPASSLRDREGPKGRRDGKGRSGSVSIMQRATTALEAAGLVRKKSTEAVRDDKERERERSKESERRIGSGDEPRSSHGSGSSKLSKSPHARSVKDYAPPSTPPPELQHPLPDVGSPWVMTENQSTPPPLVYAPTPANSPGELSSSLPGINKTAVPRNRASILTAFRLWFHEDRKGKRKEAALSSTGGKLRGAGYNRTAPSPSVSNSGSVKKRMSGSGKFATPRAGGHRAQRPSVSSRRSSSVNSRRSSGTSAQIIMLDSPHVLEQPPHRRSLGSHTPNSERGEFSSRPSSIRSLSMQRHRKSPSASSGGSAQAQFRTASPLQKHHKRGGSGSSSTRVVRQVQPTHNALARHHRSNSTTSSVHSPASSRPTSFYEEADIPRTSSPFRAHSRRSLDDNLRPAHGSSTFIAQKKQAPFTSPGGHYSSIGRSSWKKSWGLEPPGWQSRTTHIPIEVLAISSPDGVGGIRDVFSGKQSLSAGDESDWVDEDDEIPAFAGGLGQLMASASNSSSFSQPPMEQTISLAAPPRGHRLAKRTNRNTGVASSSGTNRQKANHSPVERAAPLPVESVYDANETRGGRRQLPPGRSGPAFRHPIQEEDEGEEE
jgi:Protein kinase domain